MAGDDDLERLDTRITALRTLIEEQGARQAERTRELRVAVAGGGLAVGLAALTATTWADLAWTPVPLPYTLWGLTAQGWLPTAMLVLVAVTVLGTVILFLADRPTRGGHLVLLGLASLTAAWVLVVDNDLPDGWDTAPGGWLTLAGALAVAVVHGARASELR